MNDTKNILLAWISSVSSVFTAIEARTWITLISAIVMPVVFFTLGKTVDVLLQIYFKRREEERPKDGNSPESGADEISVATGGAKRNL